MKNHKWTNIIFSKNEIEFIWNLYNIVYWSVKPVLYKFSINSLSIIRENIFVHYSSFYKMKYNLSGNIEKTLNEFYD